MRSATRKKTGKDAAYLDWIREFPCALCPLGTQRSQTEAAHVGVRGLSQKSSDRETIPLCAEHHRLHKFSAHRLGKKFWQHFGLNRDALIAALNYAFDNRAVAA